MDIEGGFADMLLWACLLSVAQAIGAVIVEKYRESQSSEEGDPLRAIAFLLQEELGRIADSLEEIAAKEDMPPKRKRGDG